MARFIVVAIVLTTLGCSSLAMPQNPKEDKQGPPQLQVLPPESSPVDSRFFFFPFNFWNGFRPLPWIPLPGLIQTTAAPANPGGENEDGDDDDNQEGENEDGDDDDNQEGENEDGDDDDNQEGENEDGEDGEDETPEDGDDETPEDDEDETPEDAEDDE